MNTYVKIAIVGVAVFVAFSILMLAVPVVLLLFLNPVHFVEPEIQIYGDCTISPGSGEADVERYLMIPEQSCEFVCMEAGAHGVDVRCQFESESVSWDKSL